MNPVTRHKEILAAKAVPLRHPFSEFQLSMATTIARDLRYPRAGVRRQADGQWLLQVWYAPQVVRHDLEPLTYSSPLGAFVDAQRKIYAARAQQHPAGQLWLRGTTREMTA
ncbi:hypothetical protein AAFM46_10895 [Arthrobacter sp. TMP15]|uniref:hypothetical protein n=1 Tax=Arthrobacter sp. TMP15 TaxID=3140789 RepID=UPI0031BB837B